MESFEDFSLQLTKIFDKHRNPKCTIVSKDLREAIKRAIPQKGVIFSIHRRTTNGRVDKPVMWGIELEKDADWLVNKFFKASEVVNEETGKTECTYYEKVREDGYKAGIYDNDCAITKENDDVQ